MKQTEEFKAIEALRQRVKTQGETIQIKEYRKCLLQANK
jgi:hypothetical protein